MASDGCDFVVALRFRGLNSVGLILLGCLGTVLRGYCSGGDGGVVCRG